MTFKQLLLRSCAYFSWSWMCICSYFLIWHPGCFQYIFMHMPTRMTISYNVSSHYRHNIWIRESQQKLLCIYVVRKRTTNLDEPSLWCKMVHVLTVLSSGEGVCLMIVLYVILLHYALRSTNQIFMAARWSMQELLVGEMGHYVYI